MPSRATDLAFGEMSERETQNHIEGFLNEPLQRQGGYSTMDYSNPNKTIWAELKTRRIRHNQYPTAIIGRNKINFCSDPQRSYYFFYRYTDGIFYIKYDKTVFDTFEVEDYQRGERSDCIDNAQSCVFIPHGHLTRLL